MTGLEIRPHQILKLFVVNTTCGVKLFQELTFWLITTFMLTKAIVIRFVRLFSQLLPV